MEHSEEMVLGGYSILIIYYQYGGAFQFGETISFIGNQFMVVILTREDV